MLWWTVRQLNSSNEDTRRFAIDKLGESKDPHIVDVLLTALKHKEWNVRMGAAWGLWKQGNARAVGPLIAALKDADWHVRRTAADALGNFGDIQAVGPLIAALRDEHPGVRERTAKMLGKVGDPRAIEPLIEALRDSDPYARLAVVEALEKFGVTAKPAAPALVAALDDSNKSLRDAAEAALQSIGEENALAAYRERKKAAAASCQKCGKTPRSEQITQFVQGRICDSCGWAAIWCYQCKESIMVARPEVWPDPQMPIQAWLECEACGKRGRADKGILSWLERRGLL